MPDNVEDISSKLAASIEKIVPGILGNTIKYNKITIPTVQALGTYTIRYNNYVERKLKNEIKGYPELLQALKEFGEDNILIHGLLRNSDAFLVFSDIKQTQILGMITNAE